MMAMSNIGIEATLHGLTRVAWQARLIPNLYEIARHFTISKTNVYDKMWALADRVHPWSKYISMDADEVCLLVTSLALSVGIRCRFVGVRYGQSWTCWVAYEDGDQWKVLDPTRPGMDRAPDEQVMGPLPNEMAT
jgi:hypothetical protein